MRPRPSAPSFRLALLACLAGTSCSSPVRSNPSPPPKAAPAAAADTTTGGRWYGYEGGLTDAEKAASSIEGATQYWSSASGRWRTERDSGSFTAHVLNRRVRHLAVSYSFAGGTGEGAYVYDERARLFYFHGEERRRTGTGRSARTSRVAYSVALDPQGNVSARRKTVDGKAQSLAPDEVAMIVAREASARRGAVAVITAPAGKAPTTRR